MQPEAFRPAWWLPGAHAQTLGARLLRTRRGITLTRERLELPDGDFVDLDWANPAIGAAPRERPTVLVLHGLEGSARSTYAYEAYRQLLALDLRPVGLNFRSCSGELNRLPRLYHSGDTTDVGFVFRWLRQRSPSAALGALGFSLGGNVLLKYLGEPPADRALPDAAVAISVPFDLAAGAEHVERGTHKIYRAYLLRKLKRKVAAKRAILDGRVAVERVLRANTFREFDEAGTAPLHGFEGADDYYRRSSSAPFVPAITTPTLVIHAHDDPFLPPAAIPHAALAANPAIHTAISPRGGHVGFVAGPPSAPTFWAERRAAVFLAGALRDPESVSALDSKRT